MRNNLKIQLGRSLLIGFLTGSAWAEQTVTDLLELSPAELADIPVSIASGTTKSLAHSAAVTSVITAEQISAMGATELHEVMETVPGVHVSFQPITNDYIYTLRGIGNETNAEVLLMMNGTRFSLPRRGTHMTGMIIPVEAIQRVEVIRGPGSALYGADAFAGVINIVTKKAGDIDGTTIGARGGNADTKSSWGQHGGNWQGWDVATSLQYSHNGFDPDRIIAADAQTAFDRALGTHASLAPSAMQTQNERWNGHLNLQRKHWDLGFWAFNQNGLGLRGAGAAAMDKTGQLNGSNYLADAKFSTEDAIPDWELQLHASFLYSDLDGNFINFPAGSRLPIDTNGNLAVDSNGSLSKSFAGFVSFPEGVRSQFGYINKVPNLELTSLYKGFADHLLRVITGFRYEELTARTGRNFGPGVIDGTERVVHGDLVDTTGTPLASLGDAHRSIWSVALQDEWQFAADWHLTTGLRYDDYSDFGSTLNPRAALIWDISENLTSKLLYGQAYRPPSFLEQYQKNSASFIGNPSLRPETIETTELAFDYRPAKNLRTALNLFYYEITDLIGRASNSSSPVLTAENGNGQNGYGSEFEWDWKFHQDWNLRGNYAWQYARDQSTGRRVSNVPEHHVYTALAWNFMPKWQIQTQINWLGHRLSSPGDTRILADYETVDLTLNARKLMGYLDLTASARNLLDSHGREPEPKISYPDNLPIAPQTFYFEAAIHF